ncbi:hypothetical protein [Methylobacterium sp. J-090]|uniref:hypothetical protein n=1 Tax=Methylobacterium sp. J-090 TaxID=2836666 RepID=UPI001FBB1442|nr:hypothetical protein [Methylobacterium sp. J-090]MCJ2082761.1 hypothetical protein [Methylobacterium sp. J-090]
MATEPKKTEPAPDPTPTEIDKAVWKPPIDPGDAGGVGNGGERKIAPDTLHEAIDDVTAFEEAVRLAGRP